MLYINSCSKWPQFNWNSDRLAPLLERAGYSLGAFAQRMRHLDERAGQEAAEAVLASEALALERMIAKTGADGSLPGAPSWACSILEDIAAKPDALLTATRLFAWRGSMPTAQAAVTGWREDIVAYSDGPASAQNATRILPPLPEDLAEEVKMFLAWFNFGSLPYPGEADSSALWQSPLIRAGVAQFWFMALQPFKDASHALASAVGNLALLRSDPGKRWYSLGQYILDDKNAHAAAFSDALNPELDITPWLAWFLEALENCVNRADQINFAALRRDELFKSIRQNPLNDRQKSAIARLMDGEAELSSGAYASLTGCSGDTALRDIQKLLELGLLRKNPGGGRSTTYSLKA